METQVFIQESSTTSKASTFQTRSLKLMLGLVFVLVLLVLGMVGLCIWPNLSSVTKETCEKNSTLYEVYMNSKFQEKEGYYRMFDVPQNGTYLIYGKVHFQDTKVDTCSTIIRLCWTMTNNGKPCNRIKEGQFGNRSAEIMALDVQLSKDAVVFLKVNCQNPDTNKSFFRVFQL